MNLHIFSQFPLPRLGVLILGTMMKQRGWDVEVYVEDLRRIDFDAVAGSDLVGISTITSTRRENIIEELRRYDHPKNAVFFYDDNFAANRERAKELLQAMIRERFKFQWTTQVRADFARDTELVSSTC